MVMEGPFAPPRDQSWSRSLPRLARMRRTVLVVTGVPLVAGVAVVCGWPPRRLRSWPRWSGWVSSELCWMSIGRNLRSWGYVERADDLLVTHGALFKKLTVVPYGRMQLVDVEAGPIDGLSVWSASSSTPRRPPRMPRCAGSLPTPPPSSP